MKHLLLPLILLMVTLQAFPAESSDSIHPDEAVTYFSNARIMDGTIIMNADPRFSAAPLKEKLSLARTMLSLGKGRRAVVEDADSTWIFFQGDNRLICHGFNTRDNLLNQYNYASVDRLSDDKWFFTVGGDLSFSSVTSVGINGRVGTYLWKRILDLGLGLNVGYLSGGNTDDWNVSADLTSRFYFTRSFSQHSLSPFIGLGVGWVFCPASNFDPLGTAGFNWFLSKGSIDFTLRYGKSSKFGISAGYTISF